MSNIFFNKPFIVGKELYYIAQAVTSNAWLAGDGPFTKKCHSWLEEHLACKKVLLTNSCTAALEMAALLCEIGPGDEVVMPSFTFVSTANAFVLRGAVPVFIDIRADNLNIDERLIEQAITERTKAIVPVHYAGRACAMDEITSIADKHGLWIVEDAAQALLSTHKRQALGTIGNIGCLSFHETKNVISGEGGALLINDERLVERAEIIWEKGTNRKQFFRGEVDKYTWMDVGSSYLASDLVAAFLYAQLEQAETIIKKRMGLFRRYYYNLLPLARTGVIGLPAEAEAIDYNGHIFYIVTGSLAERTQLIEYLNKYNIHSVFHYVPLHSSPAGQRFGRTAGTMQVTDRIAGQVLRLPLYFEMTDHDVDRVTKRIMTFYGMDSKN